MHPHQWSLLTILALLHHMYRVKIYQELQMLFRLFSHPISLVKYLHWYQAKPNLIIQVNIPEINPQVFHLQSHQWSILAILSLYHHMYQLRVSTYLQVLYQELFHPINLVHYHHLF